MAVSLLQSIMGDFVYFREFRLRKMRHSVYDHNHNIENHWKGFADFNRFCCGFWDPGTSPGLPRCFCFVCLKIGLRDVWMFRLMGFDVTLRRNLLIGETYSVFLYFGVMLDDRVFLRPVPLRTPRRNFTQLTRRPNHFLKAFRASSSFRAWNRRRPKSTFSLKVPKQPTLIQSRTVACLFRFHWRFCAFNIYGMCAFISNTKLRLEWN